MYLEREIENILNKNKNKNLTRTEVVPQLTANNVLVCKVKVSNSIKSL